VPIFMRLGNRARPFQEDMPKPGVGTFRNVVVSNVVATGASPIGCSITGLPAHPVENITLSDIRLSFDGGGTEAQASNQPPEKEDAYPESSMFGVLPAYGFYVRHAKGLKFAGVQLETAEPERRHALVADDVEDLVVDGLEARCWPDSAAVIRLVQARRAFIRGCRPQGQIDLFLRLEGPRSDGVLLAGNELSGVGKIVEAGSDVRRTAWSELANHTAP
jgi:hypothetical protein